MTQPQSNCADHEWAAAVDTDPVDAKPTSDLVTLCGAFATLGAVTWLRAKGLTTPLQGRKLMHICTGPVYILCWLLYPWAPLLTWVSACLCATVPLLVSLYMLACARGRLSNAPLVQTVSRSGDRRELQAGPFWYGLIHSAAAAAYWTHNPTGVVSLLTLCVGDGVADLVGRPFGRTRWPWSAKTIVGSAAFVVGALLANFAFVALFVRLGYFAHVPWSAFEWQLPVAVLFAALVESLPLGNWDNVAVFAAVVAVGRHFDW